MAPIRSYNCQYALYDDSVCKMCSDLSSAYGNEDKIAVMDEDALEERCGNCADGADAPFNYDYTTNSKSTFDITGGDLDGELSYELFQYHNMPPRDAIDEGNLDFTIKKKHKKKRLKIHTQNYEKSDPEIKSKKSDKMTTIKCKHCLHQTTNIKELMTHNMEAHSPHFNGTYYNEPALSSDRSKHPTHGAIW